MEINNVRKYTLAIIAITIVGFLLRLYMAHLDPFLHDWDERYHALVAKNMIDNPLMPMLRKSDLIPANYTNWADNHIWVHKQPLFLWQIALSLKVFGINEYAVRYPSVLMGTLMIPMLYQITNYLSHNRRISLIAASLLCLSNFQLDLIAGIKGMDHNDIGLGFYVLASVWAWIKYLKTGKWYYAVLVGVFSGCAILVKWLYGLYVFLLWGVYLIIDFSRLKRIDISKALFFLLSLAICLLVFLPWQFYIIHTFPIEAKYEYEFNRRHISEALEGHDGNSLYYLARFPQLFGEVIWLLFFPGIILLYRICVNQKQLFFSILSGIAFLFLSLIVSTKVISHFYFVAPFMFIFIATTVHQIFIVIRRNAIKVIVAIIVFFLILKPEQIFLYTSSNNTERGIKISENQKIKNLNFSSSKQVLVFGADDYVEIMFYHNGVTAYPQMQVPDEIIKSKAKYSIIMLK